MTVRKHDNEYSWLITSHLIQTADYFMTRALTVTCPSIKNNIDQVDDLSFPLFDHYWFQSQQVCLILFFIIYLWAVSASSNSRNSPIDEYWVVGCVSGYIYCLDVVQYVLVFRINLTGILCCHRIFKHIWGIIGWCVFFPQFKSNLIFCEL